MTMYSRFPSILACAAGLLLAGACTGQQLQPQAAQPSAQATTLPRFGLGFQASTLGPGLQFAARVLDRADVRAGISDFSYSHNFSNDGMNYGGTLGLRSVSAQFDWFFWKSFHLSPGALVYNGNQITATVTADPGSSFTLGDTTYVSDPNNPVSGTGQLRVRHFAPMITFGSGKLVNRDGGHFGMSFEIGFAAEGAPQTTLDLSGNVCSPTTGTCQAVTSSSVQADVTAEQNKMNGTFSHWYARFYPILSLGLHYAF